MRGWSQGLLIAAVLLTSASAAVAADAPSPDGLRPLCADRPGKATPPCILDAGHTQLEVGLVDFSTTHDAGERDDTYNIGGFELRHGLTRRTEVELAWTPLIVERDKGPGGSLHSTGVGDLTLGMRAAITNPDTDGLMVSVEPFVTAPTATQGLGAGGWTGGVLLPMSAPLPDGASATVTPQLQVARNSDGGGTHVAWSGAAGVSEPVGSGSLGVELWGEVDDDPAGSIKQASVDFTAAWTPPKAPNLQLDGGVNAGLNHATPQVEAYVGVSRRF